jgi:hypothetical protein
MSLISQYRNKALPIPFTKDVLTRAAVPDSLVARTLQAFRLLDLIDDGGNPTPAFEGLRRAAQADFQARLAEIVRGAYADVFQFVDPATETQERVRDVFRHYEPLGQLTRIVTLFLGLCEAAGIVPEGTRKPGPTAGRVRAPQGALVGRKPVGTPYRPPSFSAKARIRNDDNRLIPAPITGILASLPAEGETWTQERRDGFIKVFTSVLDYVYPIADDADFKVEED